MAGEWAGLRPLGEIADIKQGKYLSPADMAETRDPKSAIPVHGANGIIGWTDQSMYTIGVPLVTCRGSNCGMVLWADGPSWTSNNAMALVAKDGDTRFLYYALLANPPIEVVTGSAQPQITVRDLSRRMLSWPSKVEQKAIASLLSSLDDKIELNRRMAATLEEMARALFKSWFVDFDPVRAKAEGRDPGLPAAAAALFPDRFGDDGLPVRWSMKKVADGCRAIFSGGTPSTIEPDFWNGTLPWLSSGETRNRFVTDTEKKITQQAIDNSSTRLARRGSIVIASAGQGNTRGQTSFLLLDTHINQSVVALQADASTSSDLFLFFDLERRYDEFRRVSDGQSSRGSLTTKLIGALPAVRPERGVIAAFDIAVQPLVDRIESTLEQSEILRTLRDTLLPKLISGELRIKDTGKDVEAA
jgi:type I restriction enzyme, S subunit